MLSCSMAFMSTMLRTCWSSTLSMSIKRYESKQSTYKIWNRLSQCRMFSLTQCHLNQDKPTSTGTLDSWKDILRSGAQNSTDQSESDTKEESPMEHMQKVVDLWRLSNKFVPDTVTSEQLQKLSNLASKSSQKAYLKSLAIKELNMKKKKKKKLEKVALRSEKQHNPQVIRTYVYRTSTSKEEKFCQWRAAQAMIHGQPLVFDMVYDKYMSSKEIGNTVSQLIMTEGFNRSSKEPFHIHFCNFQFGGPYHEQLMKRYGETWNKLLITVTEKSHIDIFPKDQLVYLTSDSPNVLEKFDHDKVYIVGAFVDKCQKTGVSLGKAKKLELATARLPLDNYLKWEVGGKNLTLNQVVQILMTVRETGDWKHALSFVPIRKHSGLLKKTGYPLKISRKLVDKE